MKKSPRIRENISLEREYERKIKKLSNDILKSFAFWLKPKIKGNDKGWLIKDGEKEGIAKALILELDKLSEYWNDKVEEASNKLAARQTDKIKNFIDFKYKKAGFIVKSDHFTKEVVRAQIAQQVDLIKSIPREIKERFQSVLLNNLNGLSKESLEGYIKTIDGISRRRAKTIARDQTQKALNNLIRAKAAQYGGEYYEWQTSKDERVSKGYGGHKVLQGRIYKYNDSSAIIDSYGNKGHPGDRVNCRCIPTTIFLDVGEELELIKDSNSGNYYRIKKIR